MQDTNAFLTRYMAMWHEPDAARRRAIVAALFAPDGEALMARAGDIAVKKNSCRREPPISQRAHTFIYLDSIFRQIQFEHDAAFYRQ